MERCTARIEVLETLYRLQAAIDRRDWELIEATFLPDAVGYGASGLANVLATMQAHLGGVGRTQHLLGNSIVEFSDDLGTAVVTSYARVYHVGAGTKKGEFFECMGDYTDRFVFVDGSWRLAHRTFDMRIMLGDFSVLQPAPN